ncbi:MAG: CAP domain-containing protein [Kineosporiaceae bacterium]
MKTTRTLHVLSLAGAVTALSAVLAGCAPIAPLPTPTMSAPSGVPSTAPPSPSAPATPPSVPPSSPEPSLEPSVPATPPSVPPSSPDPSMPPSSEPSAPSSAPAPPAGDAIGQEILDLVNGERAAAGCDALVLDEALTLAAQGHADDMQANDYFSHESQDGRSVADRVTEVGYDYRTVGENIARGQGSAEEVMAAWMDSAGHRANILDCDFEDLGVGYAEADGPWWVQNFGAR